MEPMRALIITVLINMDTTRETVEDIEEFLIVGSILEYSVVDTGTDLDIFKTNRSTRRTNFESLMIRIFCYSFGSYTWQQTFSLFISETLVSIRTEE